MKVANSFSTVFLQGVLFVLALGALFLMIYLPSIEGRAEGLSVFKIYSDPFVLYGYLLSIPFFVALYQALQLLVLIQRSEVFSLVAVKRLRNIKWCGYILAIGILAAGVFVRISNPDEDAAGFMMLCLVCTLSSVVVGTAAGVFQKLLESATQFKSENDYTI